MNAPHAPYRPQLTDAARPSTFAVRAIDENGETRDTSIAGEHPLTLYVDKRELLTLMTLGAAPEALAIGYLRNQRLLDRVENAPNELLLQRIKRSAPEKTRIAATASPA